MPDDLERGHGQDDEFIRHGSAEHRRIVDELESLHGVTEKLREALELTTRQLVGEWDEVQHEWRPGVLQEMQTIRKAIVGISSFVRWGGGILAVVLGSLLTLAVTNAMHLHGAVK